MTHLQVRNCKFFILQTIPTIERYFGKRENREYHESISPHLSAALAVYSQRTKEQWIQAISRALQDMDSERNHLVYLDACNISSLVLSTFKFDALPGDETESDDE